MNRKLIVRLCLIAFFLLLARIGWNKVKGDDGMMLVYFIGLGVISALWVVKYALPWFAEAFSNSLFFSGEQVRTDGGLKAAAKMAQGDYEGAIAEHEKSLADNPVQSFPVAEIAKICAEKIKDPHRALQVLQKHLDAHPWPDDEAAFLRFRMVDIQSLHLHDPAAARRLLEQLMADFPNTRHSANARHKLNEMDQAEYKILMEQRARATGKQDS